MLKNFNLARYEGKNAGSIAMIGQGAGRWPTASAVLRDLSGIAEGENSMFPADVKNGAADNAAESHAYYVRLPSVCKNRLPAAKVLSDADESGVLRLVTEKISVAAMHETVKALRAEGNAVFFAALREG